MKKNDSTAPLSLPVFRQISAIAARQDVPAFVVGGYVRDFYLGRPSTDIDVVVVGSGIGLAEELGRELRTKVSVYKTFGTAALRTRGVEVEFVGARKESYVRDSRKPQVEAGTLEDDQRRRDFTINAMAWSLEEEDFGRLVDPFDGMRDLHEGIIRTPCDPDVTFSDDPLRMMRAVRFASQLNFRLLAAKADGTENVLRVKAALRDFSRESNLSVITEDGAYYSFNVKYADEPVKLSVEMADFLHGGEAVNRPNNALDIYLQELGCESPLLVKLIMQSIYKNDRREIKHIGCKRFGVQYLLKGIYVHNDLLYFHLQLKNSSNVPFNVDYLTFKITDKKVAKRTAIQEQVVWPVRAYNNVQVIGGKRTERMVFTLPKFTLADDKQLVVELHEQQGGRHQTFTVENADLVRARVINELKVK